MSYDIGNSLKHTALILGALVVILPFYFKSILVFGVKI